MESDNLWVILSVLLGASVAVFGILRRVNHWYYVSRLGDKGNSLPPGDMGWPLLGNTLSFFLAFRSSDPDSFINNLLCRYGRTGMYKSHLFGSPCIIVCSPETCRRILLDDQRFPHRYPTSSVRLTGKTAFHGDSVSERKRVRRLTTAPINGHEALAMYLSYIEDLVITALQEWSSMDRPIEFLSEMKKVAFKIIAHIFLGHANDSVLDPMEKYYTIFCRGFMSMAVNIPGFAFHKALKARKTLVNILQTVIEKRRAMKNCNGKKGMMDLLMEVADEDGSKFNNQEIIDMLLLFLFAGHETSAHSVMWAILHLQQHPQMLQKAKDEQQEILKKRPSTQKGLSLKEIRQMDYLANVVDETLRRTNLALCLFRAAKNDVNINGYLIPKGWKVLVWTRAVHMDPENFMDPKEFNPSRWDNFIPKAGAFIPFGVGSGICPGADLAKLEMCVFLHYFLLNYKLEQINPASPRFTCQYQGLQTTVLRKSQRFHDLTKSIDSTNKVFLEASVLPRYFSTL